MESFGVNLQGSAVVLTGIRVLSSVPEHTELPAIYLLYIYVCPNPFMPLTSPGEGIQEVGRGILLCARLFSFNVENHSATLRT